MAAAKKMSAPDAPKPLAEPSPKSAFKVRKSKVLANKPRIKVKAAAKALVVRGAKNEAGERPLTKEERLRLAEAVRLGEDARRNAEGALASYGRWLLVNIFDDDATDALTNKRKKPVWRELLDLADGPKLRLSRTSLHLAVQVAAYDKRLNDEAFRALDISRKRILLPLGDDQTIRDAAHHVTATRLTAAATQEYVQAILAENAEPRLVRMTPKAAGARVSRASKLFTDKTTFSKWKNQLAELSGTSKTEAQSQLQAIAKAVQELLKALSG